MLPEFEDTIHAYLDGELNSAGQSKLFLHLSACTECSGYLQTCLTTRTALKEEEIGYPNDLDEKIFHRIALVPPFRISTTTNWWQRPLPVFLSYGLSIFLIAFLVSYLILKPGKTYQDLLASPVRTYVIIEKDPSGHVNRTFSTMGIQEIVIEPQKATPVEKKPAVNF